jgi:tRNA-splicing ligase RtcB
MRLWDLQAQEVLGYHAGSIRIVHRLQPLGVAMASADVFDSYKD